MALTLLLDEQMSPEVEAQIQGKRSEIIIISVQTWRNGALRGQPDELLLRTAMLEGLTLVTYDVSTMYFLACSIVIASVPLTHWPFRATFLAYVGTLDRIADQVERGEKPLLPRRVGPFLIRQAEVDPSGFTCLWTVPAPGDYDGLVRCSARELPGFHRWSSCNVHPRWQYIVED